MLSKTDPAGLPVWKELKAHYEEIKTVHMRDLFSSEPRRFELFSLETEEILADFSKNRITEKTLALFEALSESMKLKESIEAMYTGDKINETEDRAVLHTALRNRSGTPVTVDGHDVTGDVRQVLKKMEDFSGRILSGQWKGYTGKAITDIVNIGIGGSDLGPLMATEALRPYWHGRIRPHFVSNVDGTHISIALRGLKPETTLFIISSKSFTTLETMANAMTAREWFLESAREFSAVRKHFVAVSTNTKKVTVFGIDPGNMFVFWDWVGGRFSLWSAIGLVIACTAGFDRFREMLEGAYVMDCHFRSSPLRKNIPVILAWIGIWYRNFFSSETEAVIPYDQLLNRFPAWLQQVAMESNGKSVGRDGQPVRHSTGTVVWGEPGTNGQHAFFQLIHQGTSLIPCDFLAPALSPYPIGDHHAALLSNFFAQTEALMNGLGPDEVRKELARQGLPVDQIEKQLPFRVFGGNRPSNSILYRKLSPRTLGALLALYEHKVFVQGVLWNIYSFDQWGVELGKTLAGRILQELRGDTPANTHDSSTNGLINAYRAMIKKAE